MKETNSKTNAQSGYSDLADVILGLSSIPSYSIDTIKANMGSGLELESISKICASAWAVEVSDIVGRLRHNKQREVEKQYSFLWAAKLYSPFGNYPISEFMGCRWGSVFNAFNRTNATIRNNDRVAYPVILKIVEACEKSSKGFGKKLIGEYFKPKYQYDFQTSCDTIWNINLYQYSAIPIKEILWFKKIIGTSDNTGGGIHVYHHSTPNCTRIQVNAENIEHLYLCQNAGYRFTTKKEFDDLKKRSPICDKCFNKNICDRRGNEFLMKLAKDCFVPLEDARLTVPIEFLYPFEKFQLQ